MKILAILLFHSFAYRLPQNIVLNYSLLNMNELSSLHNITIITYKHNKIRGSYFLISKFQTLIHSPILTYQVTRDETLTPCLH